MAKILLLEDEPEIAKTVVKWLRELHHLIEHAHTSRDAADRLAAGGYDLLILDWTLPDGTGIEVLKEFRSRGGQTPVLMLTAHDKVTDKAIGFSSGSDDYLTKPFDLRELSMRVDALLRRGREIPAQVFQAGQFHLDKKAFVVRRDDEVIALTPKEFALLEFFFRQPNQVFSSTTLLTRVWSTDSEVSIDTVLATIKRLRKKLDKEGKPSVIENVFAVGYRFVPPSKS